MSVHVLRIKYGASPGAGKDICRRIFASLGTWYYHSIADGASLVQYFDFWSVFLIVMPINVVFSLKSLLAGSSLRDSLTNRPTHELPGGVPTREMLKLYYRLLGKDLKAVYTDPPAAV